MLITKKAFLNIRNTLGALKPECGGILGIHNGVIKRFHLDVNSQSTDASYYPNVQKLNSTIEKWSKEGVTFCGIVHSHPHGDMILSHCDLDFARKVLVANKDILQKVYFPIVTSAFNSGEFSIKAYRIEADNIITESITLVEVN